LDAPATVYSALPPSKLSQIRKFAILAEVTSGYSGSDGYARVLTHSLDDRRSNFMLGQWEEGLVFRLRAGNKPRPVHFEVEGVFRKGERKSIALVFDGKRLSLYENGLEKAARQPGPLEFSAWDAGYPLVIGSEADGKFPWEGRIHSLAIFDRPLAGEDLRFFSGAAGQGGGGVDPPLVHYRFADGQGRVVKDLGKGAPADLSIPEHFTPYARTFLGRPPVELRGLWSAKKDIILNVLLFTPLGFFLAGRLISRGFSPAPAVMTAVAMGFGLSLAVEITQAFLPGRESDFMDLITNTAGTAAGSLLGRKWA
jgi:hypothetical protein